LRYCFETFRYLLVTTIPITRQALTKVEILFNILEILQQSVRGMRENLASENRQLRLEQGRQERLAVSITDQMHSEAQVIFYWLIQIR
jgi:hypothetical protein